MPGSLRGPRAKIGEDALDCIRATEAYPGGKGEAVYYLNDLDNEAKHRIVYALGIHLRAHTLPIFFTNTLAGDVSNLFSPEAKGKLTAMADEYFWGPGYTLDPIKEGVPLLIVPGEPQNDPKFRFEVAFAQPEIVQAKPVLPTLTQYGQAAEALIESFAPLF